MNTLPIGLFFCFILFLLEACQQATPSPPLVERDSTQTAPEETPNILSIQGNPIPLVVRTTQAIVRKSPSLEAIEIARYSKGDSLLFTNKISSFKTKIKLEGIAYHEPWLRVILKDNTMGWVFGGCINFDANQQVQLKEKVLDQRAVTLFGKSLAQQIGIYQKEVQSLQTLPGFSSLYARAQQLKDSLEGRMALHLQQVPKDNLPNFFWLNELLPGFLVHYIPEQRKYYLFKDLKQWQQLSLKTSTLEDDHFMEVLLASYPSDSISFHYYGWQLPVDSTTTCSLLGSSIHSNVLNKITTALDSNGYFQKEINQIKQAIVDDISTANHYWLPINSIQSELDNIIQEQYSFFTVSDWVALKTRRQMLNNHAQNGIVLNLFEGK